MGVDGAPAARFSYGVIANARRRKTSSVGEAALCHSFGANLAACAMCGAAAESIVLAIAIAKTGDEGAALKTYLAHQGRKRTIDSIIHGARAGIADAFKAATDLLSYWRDEAAHGTASEISEIEAHTALARLVRFAQFACDNWTALTDRQSGT
jgi:hypothetical protein